MLQTVMLCFFCCVLCVVCCRCARSCVGCSSDIDRVGSAATLKDAARCVRYFEMHFVVNSESEAKAVHGVMRRTGEDAANNADVMQQLKAGFPIVDAAARKHDNMAHYSARTRKRASGVCVCSVRSCNPRALGL